MNLINKAETKNMKISILLQISELVGILYKIKTMIELHLEGTTSRRS
jgi:hypothetical protein